MEAHNEYNNPKEGLTFKELFWLIIGIIISLLITIYFPVGEIWIANLFLKKKILYTATHWAYFAFANGIVTFIMFYFLIRKSSKENEGINDRSI